MTCTVLVFAQLAERLGASRFEIELAEDATVADALDTLAATHPPVGELRASLAVAVNERYSAPTVRLREGDTIALIPPVSGG